MDKRLKYIFWPIAALLIVSLNLSSSCKPSNVAGTSIVDIAKERPEISSKRIPINTNKVGEYDELTWRTLADVEFEEVFMEELDMFYFMPVFGDTIQVMNGRDVYITGYVIPVDYDEDFYVLSRYPFANCFFCGGAGPESVVDLRFPGKTRAYKTDERLTFKGQLRLNSSDVYEMNYILEGATEMDL